MKNLKYTNKSIDVSSLNGNIDILKWWKEESGRKMKYTIQAIKYA